MVELRALWSLRKVFIVVLTPLILLPLLLANNGGQEMPCAYVIITMAVFWVSEALPISITGLLPVFLFPLFGIMSAANVAAAFFKQIVLLFIGSMMVAISIEKWNIHRRMALRILLTIGSQPIWLMLGLMLTAWFLSMWISNAATTAMLLPISLAVVEELKKVEERSTNRDDDVCIEMNNTEEIAVPTNDKQHHDGHYRPITIDYQTELDTAVEDTELKEPEIEYISDETAAKTAMWTRLSKAFCLCIAYSANVGGTGSPTGRTSNFVLRGQLDIVYEKLGEGNPVTFASWLMFAVPTSLVIVLCTWIWLQIIYLRCSGLMNCFRKDRSNSASKMREVLNEQYQKLGRLSFGQAAIIGHFVVLVILWITRDLGGKYGWSNYFEDGFIKDAVPAALVGTSLFIFPSKLPCLNKSEDDQQGNNKTIEALMTWQYFTKKMPWDVVLLIGGGMAMAKGSEVSGLSSWVGSQLTPMGSLNPWVLNLCLCFVISIATEVTSNTATTSLMMPIVADLAINVGIKPVYLMMPTGTSTAFAFMLPVATASNAIAFSTGHITVLDMVKAGCFLNVICVLVLVGSTETLGKLIFL